MVFESLMMGVTKVFEAAGVGVLALGAVYVLARYAIDTVRSRGADAVSYGRLRDDLGRTILLALEILVAADIIRTLAVKPSLENLAGLGLLVVIRTFLSFSLEIEIDGALPWRRGRGRR